MRLSYLTPRNSRVRRVSEAPLVPQVCPAETGYQASREIVEMIVYGLPGRNGDRRIDGLSGEPGPRGKENFILGYNQ